jgi:VWFA-related protein
MRAPRIFLPLLSLVFAVLAVRSAAAAEEEPFSERFDVRVINVEAVVEDAAGRRIEGLKSEDFELLVDGKPQPVEYFSEIRGHLVTPSAVGAGPEGAAAPAEPALPAPPALEALDKLPTCYLVFFDLSLAEPRRAGAAGERLAEQLAQLPAEDRIALFVFDGRQLQSLADWREPRDKALAALRGLAEMPSTAAELMAEQRLIDRRVNEAEEPDDWVSLAQSLEETGRRHARAVEAALVALGTSLRIASPPPGRRVVLSFAAAWPRDLAAHFGVPPNAPENLANRVRAAYPKKAYAAVHQTANLLGYTLYPSDLDTGGATGGSAEIGDVGMAGRSLGREADRDFERDATFQRYAAETGGQAFTGGFVENTLTAVREDVADFYWLGFAAKRQDKDKDHKIEVRVKKPGLEVRSRQQFSDLSRASEIDQEIESRLLFGQTRVKEDFNVMTGEPLRKSGEMTLEISLRVPLDRIVFLPKGKKYEADVELRVISVDRRGGRSPQRAIRLDLEGPQPLPGQFATYETKLRLSPDTRRFVLGLYDKVGDSLLISTVDLGGY